MDRETIKFLEDQVKFLTVQAQNATKDIDLYEERIAIARRKHDEAVKQIQGFQAAIKKLRE